MEKALAGTVRTRVQALTLEGYTGDDIYERVKQSFGLDMTFREFENEFLPSNSTRRHSNKASSPNDGRTNKFKCRFCNYPTKSGTGRSSHERWCDKNPNRWTQMPKKEKKKVQKKKPAKRVTVEVAPVATEEQVQQPNAALLRIREWESSAQQMMDTIEEVLLVLRERGHIDT